MTEADVVILLVGLAALGFFFVVVWSMVQPVPRRRPPRDRRSSAAHRRNQDGGHPIAEAIGDTVARAAGHLAARGDMLGGDGSVYPEAQARELRRDTSGYSHGTVEHAEAYDPSVHGRVEADDPSTVGAVTPETFEHHSSNDHASDAADSGSSWDLDFD